MSDREKTHLVVTRYVIFGRPERHPIVHTYGPYTAHQASHVRVRIRTEYAALVDSGALEVSTCKVINLDAAVTPAPTWK